MGKKVSLFAICFIIISTLAYSGNGNIYDKDGKYKGRIEKNKIYDEKGNLQYTIDHGNVYDKDGNYKYKMEKGKEK